MGPGPIWAQGRPRGPGHALTTRPGHAITRPGHAMTRPSHAIIITRPGHAITRPGHLKVDAQGPIVHDYIGGDSYWNDRVG